MSEALLVFTSAPDRATAERIATTLVENKLAACVNVLAECLSIYRWKDKLERAAEVPLLIKTTRAAWPALQDALRELHPYDVPEIIALPVDAGLPAYLDWVAQEVITGKP